MREKLNNSVREIFKNLETILQPIGAHCKLETTTNGGSNRHGSNISVYSSKDKHKKLFEAKFVDLYEPYMRISTETKVSDKEVQDESYKYKNILLKILTKTDFTPYKSGQNVKGFGVNKFSNMIAEIYFDLGTALEKTPLDRELRSCLTNRNINSVQITVYKDSEFTKKIVELNFVSRYEPYMRVAFTSSSKDLELHVKEVMKYANKIVKKYNIQILE